MTLSNPIALVPMPAARARAKMSAAEWVDRAIQLARSQRLDGALHFTGVVEGAVHYRAPSPSSIDYHVVVNMPARFLSCDCPHFVRGLPCGHIGSAFLLLRRIQERTAERCFARHQVDAWAAALRAS